MQSTFAQLKTATETGGYEIISLKSTLKISQVAGALIFSAHGKTGFVRY
jgi:hypothetical protein